MRQLVFISVCFVLALLSLNDRAHADATADAALAKYRAYVGWTLGDGSIQTLRLTGRVADLSTYDEICDPSRFAQFNIGLSSGRSFLVQGSSGTARVSHLGEAKVLPAEGAADAFTQSMLLCNAFASYPATTVAERAKFIVVSLAIPNEPAVLVSINKDTGEIGSAAIQGIASYRPMALKSIDARHRIYTQWKRMVSEDEGATMSVTSIQLNPKVSPDVFTSPMDSPPAQTPDGVVHF